MINAGFPVPGRRPMVVVVVVVTGPSVADFDFATPLPPQPEMHSMARAATAGPARARGKDGTRTVAPRIVAGDHEGAVRLPRHGVAARARRLRARHRAVPAVRRGPARSRSAGRRTTRSSAATGRGGRCR